MHLCVFFIMGGESMNKTQDFTKGVIWKQLLFFFFPILIGSFFQQLYNTVDTIIVGQACGTNALAAVGSTGNLTNLVVNFYVGLSTGASVVIAQYYGAHNKDKIHQAVHTSYMLAIVSGIIMMLFGLFFSYQCLDAIGVPHDILNDASLYMRLYFLGMIPGAIYNIGSGILRAVGDSKRPLYYLIICSIVNVVFDFVFVVILHKGIAGAAIATFIAQTVCAILVTIQLMFSKNVYQLTLSKIKFHLPVLKKIVKIGAPAGIQSTMYSIANIVLQTHINAFGTQTIASWSVYVKIDALFWMVMAAIGAAITTFVGQNYGAHLYDRIQKGARTALAIALTMAVSLSVILCFGGSYITKLFSSDPAIVNQCQSLIFFLMPFYFSYCCVEIFSGTMRGCGESFKPMILVCLGICVLRVAWVTFISPHYPTLKGVVISYPITWFTTSFLFIIYYKHFKKDHFGA